MTITEPQHLTLFDVPALPHEATLDERFAAFIAANPHFLPYMASLARPIAANGRRTSTKALFEYARYNHAAFADPSSVFALNNDFTSRTSRALVERYPELAAVFEMRRLSA